MIERGTLALVVGPSGVGKDSLIALAKARLCGDDRFRFPQRAITRSVADGAERHVALAPGEFEAAEARGAYILSWRSHNVAYGIPRTVVSDLENGCVVVVNVSRTVIGAAAARVRSTVVIHVTAPREALLHRLSTRGRETVAEIEQRLERVLPLPDAQASTIEIDNSGPIEIAGDRFMQTLLQLADGRADSAR